MKIIFLGLLVLLWAGVAPAQTLPEDELNDQKLWVPKKQSGYDSGYALFCSSGDCPPYVGSLVFRADPNPLIADPISFCSVTLISPTEILTSTHCIPKRLQVVGAACADDMDIRFPQLPGYPAENHVCQKIEKFIAIKETFGGKKMDVEWAIISVTDPTTRPTAHAAQKALPMGTKIYGYPVSYNPFFATGEISKVTCDVSELGFLYPQTFSPESALFYASDCTAKVIPGNSGTSLFDASNSLVALLSGITNHKFQSMTAAASQGSELIVGTKSLCMTAFGSVPEMCALDPYDPSFSSATVTSSTLYAFVESLRRNKVDQLTPQPSKLIQWAPANEQNVSAFFEKLYSVVDFGGAHRFFTSKHLSSEVQALTNKAVYILGQVPQCVTKSVNDNVRRQDVISYTVFSFADFELHPYEGNKLYFRMVDDKRLEVDARKVNLPVVIYKNPVAGSDNYIVEYERTTDHFELSAGEKNLMDNVCPEEQRQKVIACEKDLACENSRDVLVASPACQAVYKTIGFASYLQKFSFEVPGC